MKAQKSTPWRKNSNPALIQNPIKQANTHHILYIYY